MTKLIYAVKGAEVISERFNIPLADLVDVFADIPSVDAESIVRCKDCEYSVFFTTHYNEDGSTYRLCNCSLIPPYADCSERNPDTDYCSFAKRWEE